MKTLLISMLLVGAGSVAQAQTAAPKDTLTVDAACGQCRLGLTGKDCDLAVRIDGKAYYVDGTHIDGHGDAHAADGFCNAVRKAKVVGTVVDGRFKSTYFQLLPEESKPKVKKRQSK